jgi:peptidoglycan/xylan/chitin deacetylase (PgdA/CDA1 family)
MRMLRTHALMYHDVVTRDPDASGFPGPGPTRYKLPWTNFIEHLDDIQQTVGRPPDIADDLLRGEQSGRCWLITFDDGGASCVQVGEELVRRQWRGHFFITTSLIGVRGFLDASAIRALRSMGHVIGSHSTTHPHWMGALSWEELRREWSTSIAILSDLVGEQVRTASVPGGYYKPAVALAAETAGIAALFTSEPVRAPRQVGACLVIGRHSILRDTSAREAARAAAGDSGPWIRQYVAWNLRKPLKALGGERYDRVRRTLLPLRSSKTRD